MSDAVPVAIASLRGQLLAAHKAIIDIWSAASEPNTTDLQRGANIDQAVYEAIALLPLEMRHKDMPKVMPTQVDKAPIEYGFEDLL